MKQLKSKIYTFSAKNADRALLDNFKESLGEYSFSEAMIAGVKTLIGSKKECSIVEKQFDEYCRRNHLSKDAQLKLLMGPYRVSNSIEDDFTLDKEVNFYAAD